jgi:glycosyltransferase involved in cell wall biosynthesis
MSVRVCVVTAGHLSTCPRMLKTADALQGAGYDVRVVSTNHTAWATDTDRLVASSRRWAWTVVDYDRATARARQLATGARFRAAGALASGVGAARVPLAIAIRAYSRAHDELVRAIASQPADLVYGGTTGALAAIAVGAARLGVPYGIDFEDFHSAELEGPGGELAHALASRIERHVLSGAAFATTSSPMIADAYAQAYGVRPIPIHNTFTVRMPEAAPEGFEGIHPRREPAHERPLRVYWFSQTLGPGRGLEDVIRALGRSDAAAELHLRARPIAGYAASLRGLQRDVAPRTTIVHHDPASPDTMVELAQRYDAGLSCEEPNVLNHRLCLTNKTFTYLAAGVPVILSRTPAQALLARDLGAAALSYECGDVHGLADLLGRLAGDAQSRCRARCAARAAATRRWHWEHPDDRGALLSSVAAVVGAP